MKDADVSQHASRSRSPPVCEVCGSELDLWQMDCPICEANRRRKRLILTVSVAALVAVVATGAAVTFVRPKPRPEPTVLIPPPGPLPQPVHVGRKVQSTNDLRVGSFTLRKDPSHQDSVASGDIVNDSEDVHLNVRIDLDVLAEDGLKLQTLHASINELPPHQTWHVLATTSEPDAAAVQFAGFTEDQ